MKAFLSHSSKDKEFVREVATRLGRQHCLFDEQCFETGMEFKDSIKKNLDKASIFVLFASSSSISSFWVNFEIDQAFYEKLSGRISSSLVYIIDNELNREKIPDWLKRALIKKESSPSIIANDIQHFIEQTSYDRQRNLFVGRSLDQEKIEDIINPLDGTPPPRTIAISGLPGIGRRTLIKRTCDQLFNLTKQTEIRIEPGDTINDICAKLADLAEPYSSQEELRDKIKEIKKLSCSDAGERAIKNLRYLIVAGNLPIFIDEGGLLAANGYISDAINEINKRISLSDSLYIAFITMRKINEEAGIKIPSIMLKPLNEKNTKKLVSKIAIDASLELELNEISEISEYVHGYPPAAYYAIRQCVDYGKELLLSDKYKLVKFSTQRFLKHLKESHISKEQKEILTLLTSYSPLPLIAISCYCESDQKLIHDAIFELIDKALVIVDSNSLYRIADPISNAARSLLGFPKQDGLKRVVNVIKDYSKSLDNRRKLDISRVLFRLGAILNDKDSEKKGIYLRNDFIQLVQTSYHNRNYKEAIEFGYKAIKECPDNADAREFLIRSLIQEEKWSAAESQLEELKKYTELRDVYFLMGFLLRKKGEIPFSIENFLQAENLGRRGAAIKREIAHCYLLTNQIDEAVKYITEATELQPDNSHVVDLSVKIYLKAKMEKEAKQALDRLELIDNLEFFYLRKSTFEYTFERFAEAEIIAKKAVDQGGKNFFQAEVQLCRCYIKNSKFILAQDLLNRLDTLYSGIKNDVRIALRCSLLVNTSKFKDALECTYNFTDRNCFQSKLIKMKSLRGLIDNVSISYEKRIEYKQELQTIQIANFSNSDVLDDLI